MEKRPYKILVVDDQTENIRTITSYLEQWHPEYRLYQATRAVIAIEIVRAMKIDLVVSDWDMPGMSGIELATALTQDESTRHVPVIIVTGIMISPDDLKKALSAGAFDYIRKPVEPVELEARTQSALRIVAMHREEIYKKNLELDEKTIRLARNNQYLEHLIRKMSRILSLNEIPTEAKNLLSGMIEEITNTIKEDNWQHFDVAFQNVHPSFCKNLLNDYPQLTPAELRHCILIKLGMNHKDTASIMYQSPDSIKVIRSRIRKKLRLENVQNFQSFLAQY